MVARITKTHSKTSPEKGLTPNDLKAFLAEVERAGVDMDTPLTDCSTSWGTKLFLRKLSVEG